MNQNVMVNKRADYRLPIDKECFLLNDFFDIKSQTIDASKMGAGVLVADITTPFAEGDKVVVHIKSLRHISWAKVSWIQEDIKNNSTRIGLKLHTTLGSELRLPKNL